MGAGGVPFGAGGGRAEVLQDGRAKGKEGGWHGVVMGRRVGRGGWRGAAGARLEEASISKDVQIGAMREHRAGCILEGVAGWGAQKAQDWSS